jgi:hypothetical protein
MTTVNNATGVYNTLGYNFSDPNGNVLTLSSDAQNHLNSMPAFITTWQAQAIANAGTSAISMTGLYQNPLVTIIQNIRNTANSIILNAAGTSANSNNLINTAISLASTANSFLWHTNRLSNLVSFDGSDTVNPYYMQALTYGKTALYITNQTDSITNTSPIMGSFTSLFIGPQLNTNSIIISNDYITYSTGIQGDTLTSTQYTQIKNDLNTASLLMSTRQSADVTYFTNLKNMVTNYNTLKQFNNMGESQTYLVNNFIGTPSLVSKINS